MPPGRPAIERLNRCDACVSEPIGGLPAPRLSSTWYIRPFISFREPMTDPRRIDLLDPADVARLGGIEIVAAGVVEGFLAGIHRSPFRGFSVEFTEHRAYQPGDELRYLDWKILARSDRLFVKQFEEETNLRSMTRCVR